MARRTTRAVTLACALAVSATLSTVGSAREELSRPERDQILRRAQVWLPPAVALTELGRNPGGEGGFADDATVECRFQPNGVGGSTPKFDCQLADGDEVKVKYGRDNPEVFSEVIASRLGGSTFPDTTISEEGRAFLAERLRTLNRADLRALVAGARLDRYRPSKGRQASLDEWADAMYAKVRAIVDRAPCPAITTAPASRATVRR